MPKEIDVRDFSHSKLTDDRRDELSQRAKNVSEKLEGKHTVSISKFDNTTGNPAVITSEFAPKEKQNYVERALKHLQNINSVLGFEKTQPPEFKPETRAQLTSSKSKIVHLQQQFKGIDIFQAATAVHFTPSDSIYESVGNTITVDKDIEVKPKLSAEEALIKTATYLGKTDSEERYVTDQFGEPMVTQEIELTNFKPKTLSSIANEPSIPTILEAEPFHGKIKANLLWFPINVNDLCLSWEFIVTMPNFAGQYRTIVDAETGHILYNRQLMNFVKAKGKIHQKNGEETPEMVDFPRTVQDIEKVYDLVGLSKYSIFDESFPYDWVEGNVTTGVCAHAHLGDGGLPSKGDDQNNVVIFDPSKEDDQIVIDLFYHICCMHEVFYLLGFTEEHGNFQNNAFTTGGILGDRVDGRAYNAPVNGTASMLTLSDGISPIMRMGVVGSTNRHTAKDSDVVYHEFMHGVTNRLVGGPMDIRSLDSPQSRGMGEGWGDYIACTLNNKYVVADWALDNPKGMRQYPYDKFPDTFANLGSGRYTEEHNIGEIWCAVLLRMNDYMEEALKHLGQKRIGAILGLQLVVDALKLSPTNPSFINMRDAILRALDDKLSIGHLKGEDHNKAQRAIWKAFSEFGMGAKSKSNGAQLSGIEPDFISPFDLTRDDQLNNNVALSLDNDKYNQGATAATLSNLSDSNLFSVLDKWTEVRCNDGSIARILKDPKEAFEIYAKEWSSKFNVVIDLLSQAKVEGGAEVNNKITKLFDNLNYVEATLREMYKNSYLTFASTPCSEKAQEEKRKMDRIILTASLSLMSFKIMLDAKDNQSLDDLNNEILKLVEKISVMILQ